MSGRGPEAKSNPALQEGAIIELHIKHFRAKPPKYGQNNDCTSTQWKVLSVSPDGSTANIACIECDNTDSFSTQPPGLENIFEEFGIQPKPRRYLTGT